MEAWISTDKKHSFFRNEKCPQCCREFYSSWLTLNEMPHIGFCRGDSALQNLLCRKIAKYSHFELWRSTFMEASQCKLNYKENVFFKNKSWYIPFCRVFPADHFDIKTFLVWSTDDGARVKILKSIRSLESIDVFQYFDPSTVICWSKLKLFLPKWSAQKALQNGLS